MTCLSELSPTLEWLEVVGDISRISLQSVLKLIQSCRHLRTLHCDWIFGERNLPAITIPNMVFTTLSRTCGPLIINPGRLASTLLEVAPSINSVPCERYVSNQPGAETSWDAVRYLIQNVEQEDGGDSA